MSVHLQVLITCSFVPLRKQCLVEPLRSRRVSLAPGFQRISTASKDRFVVQRGFGLSLGRPYFLVQKVFPPQNSAADLMDYLLASPSLYPFKGFLDHPAPFALFHTTPSRWRPCRRYQSRPSIAATNNLPLTPLTSKLRSIIHSSIFTIRPGQHSQISASLTASRTY